MDTETADNDVILFFALSFPRFLRRTMQITQTAITLYLQETLLSQVATLLINLIVSQYELEWVDESRSLI